MRKKYISPDVEFVLFSEENVIKTSITCEEEGGCSPHCEVVCTDECEEETCEMVCPDNCHVIF